MRSQAWSQACSAQHLVRERGLTLRNTIGRWLAAITVGGGLLAIGSPAIAAQAGPSSAVRALSTQQQARTAARGILGVKSAPDAVGDESQICLTNDSSYCIKTNGTGQQVQITNVDSAKANFTVVYDSDGFHAWQDGNGNCLREGTGGIVKIENGPCDINDATDVWFRFAYSGNNIWYNYNSQDIMYVGTNVTGAYVFAAASLPVGSWDKWNAPT
jgi:hypothetical protein